MQIRQHPKNPHKIIAILTPTELNRLHIIAAKTNRTPTQALENCFRSITIHHLPDPCDIPVHNL